MTGCPSFSPKGGLDFKTKTDSVNEMNLSPDDIRKLQENYPELSTIQIFKATKEGNFLGQSDFGHLCQAELRCFEGKCQAQKNRFGGNGEVGIW